MYVYKWYAGWYEASSYTVCMYTFVGRSLVTKVFIGKLPAAKGVYNVGNHWVGQ